MSAQWTVCQNLILESHTFLLQLAASVPSASRGMSTAVVAQLHQWSDGWRTWSSTAAPAAWTGAWQVVVEHVDGATLSEVSFTVG